MLCSKVWLRRDDIQKRRPNTFNFDHCLFLFDTIEADTFAIYRVYDVPILLLVFHHAENPAKVLPVRMEMSLTEAVTVPQDLPLQERLFPNIMFGERVCVVFKDMKP